MQLNLVRVGLATFYLSSMSLFATPEVYFSPKGGCEGRVVKLIDDTKSKLDIAIYSLNNSAIVGSLYRAKARGVKLRILLDRVQAGGNRAVTLALKQAGFDVRIHSKNRIQHNKFAVADDTKVVTGSFNWTNSAENSNEENCIFLDDMASVKAFNDRFTQHLWAVNSPEKSLAAFSKLQSRSQGVTLQSGPKGTGHLK